MKITKIKIKNLFGIKEMELNGDNIEVLGTNGVGKTSIIDAIKYALTNDSDRDYIIKKGETEGEIIVETNTGLTINRKKRTNQTDYKSIKEADRTIVSPESFLKNLFTPLQINPVDFINMTKQEQNKVILDLIEFEWDLNWIKEQFGELPSWVNYDQNILQILNDIQSENGDYFTERQNVNRDIRNKRAFTEDIAKDIPANYQHEKWAKYDLNSIYEKLSKANEYNSKIERAKAFKSSYDNKIMGYQAEKEIQISGYEKQVADQRNELTSTIERLKAEIKAHEETLLTLDAKLDDKKQIAEEQYNVKVATLEKDMDVADEYIGKTPIDTADINAEITEAKAMIKHLNEYNRMKTMLIEIDELVEESERYTAKIQKARELPAEILETAKLPISDLTIENGIPLINGLPVSNLSEGEKLSLCIDIAVSKPNSLQIILIDGVERLSEKNREKLYEKCREKDLQFIATRTTDEDELQITTL